MGLSSVWATGPRALAAAIGLAAALKFVKWLLEFIFARLDVSRSALGQRLEHVEKELDGYREATMVLLGVVAKLDPGNDALGRVAQILRLTPPRSTIAVDEIARRLNEMPGTGEGKNGLAQS